MRKLIILLLIFISLMPTCMLLYIKISNDNINIDSSFYIQSYKEENSNVLIELEKDRLNENEILSIKYINDSTSNISEYTFSSNGFDIETESSNGNEIQLEVKINNTLEYSCLEMFIELSNENELSCNVFSFTNEYGSFISVLSYDDAKNKYCQYASENDLMDLEEIDDYINNNIKDDITLIISEQNTYSLSSISLNTKFLWKDDKNNVHPLAYTKLDIIDNSVSTPNVTTYYTDDNGYISGNVMVNSLTNIDVKIYAAGVNTSVHKNYVFGKGPEWFCTIEDFNVNTTELIVNTFGNTDYGRAQQVSQALIYADMYATIMNKSNLPCVKAIYPALKSNYNHLTDTIRISGYGGDLDYYDWDVTMHEYGHHVTSNLEIENNPGLSHSSSENLSDIYGKVDGIRLAWDEALATVFGAMAQEYFSNELHSITNASDAGYTDISSSFPNLHYYYDNIMIKNGESCERTIIGILWDLYDSGSELHDDIALGHQEFWDVTKNSHATTLSEFTNYFYAINYNNEKPEAYNQILEYYRAAPENIHTSIYPDELGYEAPTFEWVSNGTSVSLPNNKFKVKILSEDESESIVLLTTNTFLTINGEHWAQILTWSGDKISVSVAGYQENDPETGPYWSGKKYFTKPIFKINEVNNIIHIIGTYFEITDNVVIPSMINGKNVESISECSFKNYDKIVNITLPNTIISIGESAFEGCENLESITLPSSLTSIGSNAFKGCSSLTELVIPNSVETMGDSILSDCFDITELTIPYLNKYMGELFGLDNYLEHSNPKIQLQTLTISGGGIIPDYAFYNFYSLENIYLPNTITSIGSNAFYNGNIRSIELPESLVSIGDYAFYDCNKLTNIIIPNSVATIGNNAFEWCDELTTVEIQKDTTPITSIGVNVFNYCLELENIIVPMSKILKYKNANNWSNYSNKISYDDVAEGMYVMYVNCYTDISEDEELQSRKSIVYELNVDCIEEYNIICSTTEEVVVYLYDSNMELSGIYPTYSNSNHTATFITELPLGIYYLEISYSDYQKSGSISTTISPSNGSIHYTKTTGMTSILPHLHKVSSNTYKAQFSFTPTYKTGLHKLSLSGTTSSGSNIVFGSGSISVYDNLSKITPMYQYSMLGLDNLAVSGGKEILVYLEKNETYYIDVTLSSNQYSALNLQILTYYNCEIGAADLPPYDISIMSNNKSYGSDLCEFILHDAMDFTVTIEGLTEGKFIIYQEVTSEEGIISYSLVKEESFTGDFTDSFSLEAGSYYIGYIDASTSNDMNYDIMRIVVD